MTKWELDKTARRKAASLSRRYGLVVASTRCDGRVPPTTYRIGTVVPETGCRLAVSGSAWARPGRAAHPPDTHAARSATGPGGTGTGPAAPGSESSRHPGTAAGESRETDAPAPASRD